MSSVNKVILIGNLGADPETRKIKNGDPVCNFRMATSYKPKDGEERTEWHRIAVFGNQATACDKYLVKGSKVYVEGRLQTKEYDKDGEKRYSTEVVAERVQFLSPKESGDEKRNGSAASKPMKRPARDEDDASF